MEAYDFEYPTPQVRMLERLVNALEALEDGFALFDDQQLLVLCNGAYCSMVGVPSPDAIVGRPFASLMQDWLERTVLNDTELARIRVDSMQPSSSAARWDFTARDGAWRRLVVRRTRDGGLAVTIGDRSEDVQHEAALRRACAEVDAARSAKNELLGMMSHQLRTPLNAMLGFAQLMRRDGKDPLSPRHRVRVDQILQGGEHVLRLIENVLDLSRIEAGRTTISIEAVRVPEVMEEVRRTLDPMAARAGVQIQLETPSPAVPMVAVDRSHFAQVLTKLGSNAIKYNRPSGGTITLAASSGKPGYVRLSVADNGIGIPEDWQDRIFEPFQRAGQETGPIAGTGIGLTITKRLVELMQGTVGFRSVSSRGSEFWVEVPVHRGN